MTTKKKNITKPKSKKKSLYPKVRSSMGGIPISTTSSVAKEIENRKKQSEKRHKENEIKRKQEEAKQKLAIEDMLSKNDGRVSEIKVKDFVVRRSTFKCLHRNHTVNQIDAVVAVIDKKGNLRQEICSAGYCRNCSTYFIMESTYQSLRKKGILACRISDEKSYVSGKSWVNGMLLAQESILKQYGYSVSQEDGASDLARKRLLSLLIDKGVVDKSTIVSYLDFFISQHSDSRYEYAVGKWESDRKFVNSYRRGTYETIAVLSITRKTTVRIH